MKNEQALPCAHPKCSRKTRSDTGRCQDHRLSTPLAQAAGISVPPGPTPSVDVVVVKERKTPLFDGTDAHGIEKRWLRNGAEHRLGAPAVTVEDAQGNLYVESYFRAGRRHRIDGPCVVFHVASPKTTAQRPWFEFRGVEYDTHAEVVQMLANRSVRGEPEFLEEVENSGYRVFLDEGHTPEELYDVFAEGIASIEGVREVLGGAPIEWVRSWESSSTG